MQNRMVCFCAYAFGRLRRRKRLFGLTQTLARRPLFPCIKAFCPLYAYFTFPVCLLQGIEVCLLSYEEGAFIEKTCQNMLFLCWLSMEI